MTLSWYGARVHIPSREKHVFLRVLYKRMERTLVKFLHIGDPGVIAEDHAALFG
jgi:hypothetical protein